VLEKTLSGEAEATPGWPLEIWRIGAVECWLRHQENHRFAGDLLESKRLRPLAIDFEDPAALA
jgi:hypothetical protein